MRREDLEQTGVRERAPHPAPPASDGSGVEKDSPLHFAPGAIAAVDDERATAVRLIAHHLKFGGPGAELKATSIDGLDSILYPMRDRRPPVRVFYLDLFLSEARYLGRRPVLTALDVMEWLDSRYPCTPRVIYTRSDPELIASLCGIRRFALERVRELRPDTRELLEAAGVAGAFHGVIRVGQQRKGTFVVDRDALLDPAGRLPAFFERTVFGPWDAHRIAFRRHVRARAGGPIAEHFYRSFDAYREHIPQSELHIARGLGYESMQQELSDIRDLVRCVHMDVVEKAYLRAQPEPHDIIGAPFRRPAARAPHFR